MSYRKFSHTDAFYISIKSTIVTARIYAVGITEPVTVAEQSKACTVFVRSEAGIVGSIPQKAWTFVMCLFCVCVVLCLGRGLATS
jgi:hypothetical protein